LRRITQELGRRLVAEGILSKKDDLYFLSFKEALDFFAGNNEDHYKKQIQKNKAYYNSFRNFEKPNEIIPNQGPWEKRQYSETNSFRGIACSPGVIEGEVSVVISIDKLDQLRTETILVTKFTDTGWTPVFSKIAGLITETGGLLSHGAIVSREFGIPAVLAVSGITEQLKSGMRVRLNGDTGQVTVL
jgi:pyruvate,water dikinase